VLLSFESGRDVLHGQVDAFSWDATFRDPVRRMTSDRECPAVGLTSALTSDVMSVGSFGVLNQLLAELRSHAGRKVMLWITDGLAEPRCTEDNDVRAHRAYPPPHGPRQPQWCRGVRCPSLAVVESRDHAVADP